MLTQVLEPVAVWTGWGEIANFPLKQDRTDVKSANARVSTPLTLDNIVLALKEVCNLGDFLGLLAAAEGMLRKKF